MDWINVDIQCDEIGTPDNNIVVPSVFLAPDITLTIPGHGVGLNVWELPQVPNYGLPGRGPKLQVGMVLALEPMINMGDFEVETEDDGWTVVTKDRKLSAHFEHTIAITDHKTEILTEGIEG